MGARGDSRPTPMAQPLATQCVGDIRATTLRTGRLHLALEFGPEHNWRTDDLVFDDRGRAILDVLCLLVQTPRAVIVVDPSSWDQPEYDERFDLDILPGRSLDSALAEVGVDGADVTHVLVTHLHPDHLSGIARKEGGELRPSFPNARHLVPEADWRDVRATPWLHDVVGPVMAAIDEPGLVDFIAGDRDVGDGVCVLAAPGESPGHQILRVASGDEALYFLGDLFHVPAEFAFPWWGPAHADAPVLAHSRERVLADAAERRSKVVFSHARYPGWGTIAKAGDGWSFSHVGTESGTGVVT